VQSHHGSISTMLGMFLHVDACFELKKENKFSTHQEILQVTKITL
jgi:hypothetical protein